MELPIEVIHLAVIAGVLFPELCIVSDMEAGNIGLIELLHLCDLQQTVVVITHALVPFERPALFYSGNNVIRLDDILSSVR